MTAGSIERGGFDRRGHQEALRRLAAAIRRRISPHGATRAFVMVTAPSKFSTTAPTQPLRRYA
jgi:hypothetical protein